MEYNISFDEGSDIDYSVITLRQKNKVVGEYWERRALIDIEAKNEQLQKQVEVLKGALVEISCNDGDGQDNELVPCCAAWAALKQCEEINGK